MNGLVSLLGGRCINRSTEPGLLALYDLLAFSALPVVRRNGLRLVLTLKLVPGQRKWFLISAKVICFFTLVLHVSRRVH